VAYGNINNCVLISATKKSEKSFAVPKLLPGDACHSLKLSNKRIIFS